jgi:hypothetical protein
MKLNVYVSAIRLSIAASLCITTISPAAAAMPSMQQTRYLGTPDLALTAALVEAGGGPENFQAAKLFGVLAGPATDAESKKLTSEYGSQRVTDFLATFTYAIRDSLKVATANKVALPSPPPGLAQDGAQLSKRLVADGTMPNGRFDVGYLIEHLVSRPIHVAIMKDMNAEPSIGPQRNADFHAILTAVIGDLQREYGG